MAFLVVLFYGAGLAIDVARKAFTDSLPRSKLNELIDLLSLETGKSSSDVRKIVEARFQKPAAAKRVVTEAKRFFQPSQKDRNAPVTFDRDTVDSDTVKEVPYSAESDKPQDFDRYTPHDAVLLEMHAQDKDKSATGWAAIAPEISEGRLKVRVMDPVVPSEIWGQDRITADVVVVSKLTSDGYIPSEIQITAVYPTGEAQSDQSPQVTE